jgi:hypothetical protein
MLTGYGFVPSHSDPHNNAEKRGAGVISCNCWFIISFSNVASFLKGKIVLQNSMNEGPCANDQLNSTSNLPYLHHCVYSMCLGQWIQKQKTYPQIFFHRLYPYIIPCFNKLQLRTPSSMPWQFQYLRSRLQNCPTLNLYSSFLVGAPWPYQISNLDETRILTNEISVCGIYKARQAKYV